MNDYKVVRIAFPSTPKEAKPRLVDVYSLKEGSWRRKASASASLSPGIMTDSWCSRAAFINGAVHFGVRGCINTPILKVCPFVLSFDLSDEVFHMIALPKFGAKIDYDFFGFRGSLSVVYIEPMNNRRCCFIWVMKECGVVKSWTNLFAINLSGEIRSVLGFQKNGHIFMQTGLGNDARLCSYDPQSLQLKNLGIYGWVSNSCADNYVESLVLLDKQNGDLSHWLGSRKRKFWVELEDESLREKETIREPKKAMTHQQEEMTTLKIEMATLKSEKATLKSQALSIQRSSTQVENTSGSVGDVGDGGIITWLKK